MTRRWLFNPGSDLLLGCGLGWLAVFALSAWFGSDTLAAWLPAGLVVMVAAIPHYGGTLLRVYESPEDRRRYRLFALHSSVAIAGAFVLSLYWVGFGCLWLTLYLTWSPWHYSGQNYGVALMLLGRRGVAVGPALKRWLYASFLLSYALTFVALHGSERAVNYAPVSVEGTLYRLIPLGLPLALSELLLPALAVGYLVTLGASGWGLLRRGRVRDVAPAALLIAVQSLWFAVPVVLRGTGFQGPGTANLYSPYGFIWIAAAHSVQYLWVTSYYALRSGAAPSVASHLGKAVLAGYAIWTLPALLFAPQLLGRVSYESGLALILAASVNLHHFVLDGAIWKLREGRIARVLLRQDERSEAPAPLPGPGWLARGFWLGGALAVAIALVALFEGGLGRRRAQESGDLAGLRRVARSMAWIGRDGPSIHREIGRNLANRGELQAARGAFRRSLDLQPSAAAWLELGRVEEAAGRLEEAQAAYAEAGQLSPTLVEAHYRRALVLLALDRRAEAREVLGVASALAPGDPRVRLAVQRAEQSSR